MGLLRMLPYKCLWDGCFRDCSMMDRSSPHASSFLAWQSSDDGPNSQQRPKFPLDDMPGHECWEKALWTSYALLPCPQVMDGQNHPALLLVDGVSSIGALEFKLDEWRVDAAVTGSQKALSLPTGLALVAFSPKVRQ